MNNRLENYVSYFLGLAIVLGIAFIGLSFSSASLAGNADQILATVNDRKVTVQDFIDFYKTRPRVARWNSPENGQNDPGAILDALIGKILMAGEACRLYPEDLKASAQQLADVETRLLINVFTEEQIDQGILISEQEVIQRMPDNQKVEVHLRRIVVASQEEALRIRKQLDSGADFASLAKKLSLGEEADKGGDIGYMSFTQGLFPKKVVEEIFQLKEGEITNPSAIREGYALFQVLGKRKLKAADLDRVKEYIRQQISLERKKERWDRLFEQLNKESQVVINEALFKEIERSIASDQGALKRMSGLEIAKINNRSITVGEIISRHSDPAAGGSRPWEKDAQVLRRILDRTIKTILVSDQARRLHYDQSAEVKKNLSRFKDDLMVRRLVAEGIYKGLTVSLTECKEYYQKHLSEYRVPERVQISQIMVPDEETAISIIQQLQKGADFNELSKKYPSPNPLTPKGFWARGGSAMGKEFEEQVFNLQEGEVSGPIKTSGGEHVVKLLKRQKEGFANMAEVESGIMEKLLSAKKEKALSDHINALRKESRVEVNEGLFQEVVKNAL